MENSTTSRKFIRTVHMSDEEVDALLERLDTLGKEGEDKGNRHHERFEYRVKSCIVHMQQPGAVSAVPYSVPMRNISAGGLCFLHGGFVHTGTRCLVQLVSKHGTWKNAMASVVYCTYIEKNIHAVAVKFDEPIDPSDFCSAALKTSVLLAEDDPSLVRLVMLYLTQLAAEVDVAENGQMAVDMALQNNYDVILMDMEMPVLDGFEATRQLRAKGYTGRIVAATGLTQSEDRQRCLDAGCDQYIPKPYVRKDLMELIESLQEEPLLSSFHDDKSMADLITNFVEELPAKIRSVEEALVAADTEKLTHVTRTLKGEAGGYGFAPITAAASNVESALLKRTPLDEIKADVDKLIKLCLLARSSTPSPNTSDEDAVSEESGISGEDAASDESAASEKSDMSNKGEAQAKTDPSPEQSR